MELSELGFPLASLRVPARSSRVVYEHPDGFVHGCGKVLSRVEKKESVHQGSPEHLNNLVSLHVVWKGFTVKMK